MALVVSRIKRLAVLGLIAAVVGGAGWFGIERDAGDPAADRLYGNVEIREVDLAFNSEGAVTVMSKREGDPVRTGEVIAELDAATYSSAAALAEAKRDAAAQQLAKLLDGNRPEDIDQARATVATARAGLADAEVTFERQAALGVTNATPRQSVDDARRGLRFGADQLALAEAALAEMVTGPRAEDIAIARAQLRQADASVALSQTQVGSDAAARAVRRHCDDARDRAWTVVMPTSVVYSIAITSEVWVRAFVPELMLGLAAPDETVRVFTDSRPGKPYTGRIGYVSPTAEFTPKTVETPELRTQLVYRVRIRLVDPDAAIGRDSR